MFITVAYLSFETAAKVHNRAPICTPKYPKYENPVTRRLQISMRLLFEQGVHRFGAVPVPHSKRTFSFCARLGLVAPVLLSLTAGTSGW